MTILAEPELYNAFRRAELETPLEKQADRFTAMPGGPDALAQLRATPGVLDVTPLTPAVFKVITRATDLDGVMEAVRARPFPTIAHHAYRPKGDDGSVYYLTDSIVVGFHEGVPPEAAQRLFDTYNLRARRRYGHLTAPVYLAQVTDQTGAGMIEGADPKKGVNPVKAAALLLHRERDLVAFAEPNLVNRFRPAYFPRQETFYEEQWHLNIPGADVDLTPGASIDVEKAWDITRGDRSIVVAVIDDGFDLAHPDFKGRNKLAPGWDFAGEDQSPLAEREDFHGTLCAGVAIAEENGGGVIGVAPGCAFLPVRFAFATDDDTLIRIFEWVGQRADVISCSWGTPPAVAPLSTALNQTITRLAREGGPRKKGCVICFASGDAAAPTRSDEGPPKGVEWLDGQGGGPRLKIGPIFSGFAEHPDVITVGASTSLGEVALYSNWGDSVCVVAPSDNFDPLLRGAYAPGRGIFTTDNESAGDGAAPNSRWTDEFGGTSCSTAVVAGIAGLMLSANPNLTAAAVKAMLAASTDPVSSDRAKALVAERTGADIGKLFDGDRRRNPWSGWGKVNAAKAVELAWKAQQDALISGGGVASGTQPPPIAPPTDEDGTKLTAQQALERLVAGGDDFAHSMQADRESGPNWLRSLVTEEWKDSYNAVDWRAATKEELVHRVQTVPFWWGKGTREPANKPFGYETRFEVSVAPGKEAAFLDWSEELLKRARVMNGFVSALLLKSCVQPWKFVGLGEWDDQDQAQAFLNSPDYKEFIDRFPLDGIAEATGPMDVFQFLAESVSPAARQGQATYALLAEWSLPFPGEGQTVDFVRRQFQRLERMKEVSIRKDADQRPFLGGVVLRSSGNPFRHQTLILFTSRQGREELEQSAELQELDSRDTFAGLTGLRRDVEDYLLVRSWIP